MEKIILNIASSLDGFVARENGDIDWLSDTGKSGYDEFYRTVDTVIMGKTTYDQVLTFGEYPYKDKKSIVFTRKNNITSKIKNVEFVSDVDKFVKDMLPEMKGNIWLVGGSKTISSFLNHGLIDEMILSVIPVILGKGIPMFHGIQQETKLELVKTTTYDKLVELQYHVLK